MSFQLFIDEIRANPEDDAPRLVFADWLEEQGDIWSQLIRLQCELSKTSKSESGSRAVRILDERVETFLKRHQGRFRAPLYRGGAIDVRYNRGFLDECRFLMGDQFYDCIEQMGPLILMLRSLTVVSRCRRLGEALAEFSKAAPICSLDINSCGLEPRDIWAITDSPLAESLETLNVSWNLYLGQEGIERIWSAPWSRLRVLDLQGVSFPPEMCPAVTNSPSPASEIILVNEGLKWMRSLFPGKVMVV